MTSVSEAVSAPAGAQAEPVALEDTVLEHLVLRIETELAALGDALRRSDSPSIEGHAAALQRALVHAMDASVHAAHDGKLPRALRMRLVRATGQLAAQWESLARATAALDRAMEALMLQPAASVYCARQFSELPRSMGSVTA